MHADQNAKLGTQQALAASRSRPSQARISLYAFRSRSAWSYILTQIPIGLQGLVNLNPCGPDDGGLIVCKGGHRLSAQFHREMADEPKIPAWTPEWFGFTENGMKWLKDHGLEWEKVCVEPGDLIVWDSRTPHYNVPPTGKQDRLAVYTCFTPVCEASQEDLIRKKGAFESMSPLFLSTSGEASEVVADT